MPVAKGRGEAHDRRMSMVNEVLRQLFDDAGETQAATAVRLTAAGMVVDQTKVSAWRRHRVPSLVELNEIEDAYGLPHGWVLRRAGFVDEAVMSVRPVTPPDDLEAKVEQLTALVNRLLDERPPQDVAPVRSGGRGRQAQQTPAR